MRGLLLICDIQDAVDSYSSGEQDVVNGVQNVVSGEQCVVNRIKYA